jgi:serine/threonine protein kinase
MEQLLGQALDRYQIMSQLGKGEMGPVFTAHDIKLERDVALKVIDPQYTEQPDFREKFLQIARTAARLEHPTLIDVTDFGQAHSWFYLVMELIPGENLLRMLRNLRVDNRWLPLGEALQIVRQICLAVAYGHDQGVWPWDVNPRNIMLKPTPLETELGPDLPYQPVLTDLGLTKLHQEGLGPREGMSMMTLAFMSPEQVLGQSLDERSDLYTLGVLLFMLTVGELPLKAKNIADAVHYHTHESIPAPQTLRPDLPEALERILLKALAKDPTQRFKNAAALAEALSTLMPARIGAVDLPPPPKPAEPLPPPETPPSVDPETKTDRLLVREPGGASRVIPIQKAVITLGRAPDNDVVLDHTDVSRHHARLEVAADGVYRITDLNSTNGIYLAGVLVGAGIPTVWPPAQSLSIADFQLDLERYATPAPSTPPPPIPEEPTTRYSPAIDPVSLLMPDNHLTVEPGQRVTASLVIQNQGRVTDQFKVTVEGIPAAWVLAPSPVKLAPNQKQEVKLTIQPPRSGQSRAARYSLVIRATSQEDPDQFAEVEGTLTITDYVQFSSEIQPPQIEAGQRARVVVINQSNTPETFTIRWLAQDDELDFEPAQTQLNIAEGQTASVEFYGIPRRLRWFGGRKIHPFSTQIRATNNETQTQQGELVSYSSIPPWAFLLVIIPALALCVLLGVFFFRGSVGSGATPFIRELTIDPPNPRASQPFTVRWQVDNADQVELRPLVTDLDALLGEYTFTQGLTRTTDVTFIASNEAGSSERPFIVTVVEVTTTPTATLPVPVVAEWSVFPTAVAEGQTVTIRWRVTDAESVVLQPFGTVEASGERTDTPKQSLVYTLIATNKEQKTERSQQVIVSTPPPNAPRVERFTAEPNFFTGGEVNTIRLTWETAQADTVTIEPNIGTVSLNGFQDIPAPAVDIVYVLKAKNAGGETQAQVQIKVLTPTPTASTTSLPTSTFTPTPTGTATPSPTHTSTTAPTNTFTPIPTNTFTPIPTTTFTPIPSTNTPTTTPTLTSTGVITP